MTTPITDLITVEQMRTVLGGRAGLVLGQDLSVKTGRADLRKELANLAIGLCTDDVLRERFGTEDLAVVLDEFASADPDAYDRFRSQAERYLQSSLPGHQLAKLSQASWSAVVSLTLDSHVETGIRAHLASRPTQRKVIAISTATILDRPALLLPVFKLLGSCLDTSEQARVALSRSEYRLRQPEWRRLLVDLPGFLREGGLVFLGTSSALSEVQDFLSAIYAGQPPYPTYLVFAEADGAGTDLLVSRMAKGRSAVYRVKATEQQIVAALGASAASQLALVFGSTSGIREEDGEFFAFRHILDLVPHEKPNYQLSARRQEVAEGLFRPNGLLWDSFLFDIELPRSQLAYLERAILTLQASPAKRPKFFVLRGEAGIGKTVVAKRLAVNLRRGGATVIWCRKSSGEYFHLYRELAKHLRQSQMKNPETKLFMFWDDPWALGLAPVEFAAALDSERVDIAVVIVSRNSDRSGARGFARLPPIDEEAELGFELTDDEEAALPAFLQRVGAITNLNDAKQILTSQRQARNARDILCRLWYLLPDTRGQLEQSLSDEYFRLEGVDRLVESLAESAAASGAAARRAYESVAVTSGLGFGVPDEILVHALNINYSEWIAICAGGKPLWGLLYPMEHPDGEGYAYFTRNEVVTEILLRQMNGGVGHAADVRTLKTLVSACAGTSPVYRDFLVELLVRNKDKLRRVVSPAEGRELYELALRTFPVSDRTLMHHYAKWVTDEVHNNKEAYEILERALETPDYPYAPNEERREFIHTSMAAVVVHRVKRGEQDRESGLLAIKRHLREASTPTFFNLFTVHVQVNALVSLQQGEDPLSLDCFVEACRAIERAQQLAGAHARGQLRNRDALEMLENQKKSLAASMAPFAKLAEDAFARFETDGDQLPLEAAALKGLIEASLADKGSLYNDVFQFIRRCQQKLGQKISPGLRQARIDLIVRWRLQHDTGEVDWNAFLGDVRVVRDEPARREDILLLFYEAVACFHLRLVDDAQATFSRLRSMQVPGPLMAQSRVWLRNKSGKPEQVQGVLSKKAGRVRVRLVDYGYDALTYRDKTPPAAQDGAIVHCWLGFTLQGPIAEFQQPSSTELSLPI